MLVGPTGSGKTTVRQILRKALVVLPSVSLEEENARDASHVSSLHENKSKIEKQSLAFY